MGTSDYSVNQPDHLLKNGTARPSRVTVVCPVFNEEDGISEFYRRLSSAMSSIEPAVQFDILLINDGSTDTTSSILHRLAQEDPRVGVIEFSRNFGHQLAITAGIDHAEGDAVVIIDSDLQDPPEVIVDMIKLWHEGYDVVYGQRTVRPGESRFKLATAHAFYRFINWLSDVPLPADAGDFRLMSRRVVEALNSIREESRYVRGLVAWVGFKQTALLYERDSRYAGETKYPLSKMLKFATDGISSFSEKPLRLATQLGMFVTAISFFLAVFIIAEKLIDPTSQLPGYASMMAIILFLGGMQLLSVGILGGYVGRIYREAKRRPLYVVADKVVAQPARRDVPLRPSFDQRPAQSAIQQEAAIPKGMGVSK